MICFNEQLVFEHSIKYDSHGLIFAKHFVLHSTLNEFSKIEKHDLRYAYYSE